MTKKKTIFIFLGASGSGKTTAGIYLNEKLGIPGLVSHTTRPPRVGEKHGYSYYFVSSLDEFEVIEKIEYAEYGGNHYALSKSEVERKLKDYDKVFVITEINGVRQIQSYYKDNPVVDVKVIYFDTTLELMEERMKLRGDSEENIKKRLEKAVKDKELENGKYADFIIPADVSLEELYKKVEEIVKGL